MLQKFAPLIILALFLLGAYFMMKGMDHATQLAKPKTKAESIAKP